MTEQEWLSCTDLSIMLDFLSSRASDRKLRLFLIACAHRSLVDSPYDELADEVPAIELFVDKAISQEDFSSAQDAINWGIYEMCESLNLRTEALAIAIQAEPMNAEVVGQAAARALEGWRMNVPDLDIVRERLAQCNFLRDIFGHPFHPVVADPSWLAWNDRIISKLVQTIYDDHAFDRLPIMADALEEAGCDNADILNHCRQPGEHVRGCWVVDLLLNKS